MTDEELQSALRECQNAVRLLQAQVTHLEALAAQKAQHEVELFVAQQSSADSNIVELLHLNILLPCRYLARL